MKFTHFHVHSQYSILDGAASIPGLIDKAVADGMPALALTDHGNMFGIKLRHLPQKRAQTDIRLRSLRRKGLAVQ